MKYVYYWVISLSKVNILNELRKYHQNIQGFELSSQIARGNTYSVHVWCFNLILTNPMNLKFLYLRQQSKTFTGPENYCLLQIASCSVEITYTSNYGYIFFLPTFDNLNFKFVLNPGSGNPQTAISNNDFFKDNQFFIVWLTPLPSKRNNLVYARGDPWWKWDWDAEISRLQTSSLLHPACWQISTWLLFWGPKSDEKPLIKIQV